VTRVRFEPSGIAVQVRPGERVLDVADEQPAAGLPLACRAGNCGACRVRVRAGGRALLPAASHERESLRELGAGSDERLACQACVDPNASDTAEIVLVLGVRPSSS
jgi:adenylate cyclase